MSDDTHAFIQSEISKLKRMAINLDERITCLQDAFYWHTHEEDPDLKDAADALNQRANS